MAIKAFCEKMIVITDWQLPMDNQSEIHNKCGAVCTLLNETKKLVVHN